jgi:dethiobiotin synthetase
MGGLLVTGTDTGVGKTTVACALVAGLGDRGVRVAVWKPVETGWESEAAARSDAARLRAASARNDALDVVCPYRFRAPLAPAVAARAEGVAIDLERLEALYRQRLSSADVVVVESAGGLLVPLVARTTYADVARRLDLAVLIVAANRLGVVNHAALTARVARAAGLRVLGFVLNDVTAAGRPEAGGALTPEDPSRATNRATIVEQTDLPCLGETPHVPAALAEPRLLVPCIDVAAVMRSVGGATG